VTPLAIRQLAQQIFRLRVNDTPSGVLLLLRDEPETELLQERFVQFLVFFFGPVPLAIPNDEAQPEAFHLFHFVVGEHAGPQRPVQSLSVVLVFEQPIQCLIIDNPPALRRALVLRVAGRPHWTIHTGVALAGIPAFLRDLPAECGDKNKNTTEKLHSITGYRHLFNPATRVTALYRRRNR
jgi:hypothetical protein